MGRNQPVRQVLAVRVPELLEVMHIHAVAVTDPVKDDARGSIHNLYHLALVAVATSSVLRGGRRRIVQGAVCGVASIAVLGFRKLPDLGVAEALQGVLDAPDVS